MNKGILIAFFLCWLPYAHATDLGACSNDQGVRAAESRYLKDLQQLLNSPSAPSSEKKEYENLLRKYTNAMSPQARVATLKEQFSSDVRVTKEAISMTEAELNAPNSSMSQAQKKLLDQINTENLRSHKVDFQEYSAHLNSVQGCESKMRESQSAGVPGVSKSEGASFEVLFEGLRKSSRSTLGNEYAIQVKNTSLVRIVCKASLRYSFLSVGDSRSDVESINLQIAPNQTGIRIISKADDIVQGRKYPTNITQYSREELVCQAANK